MAAKKNDSAAEIDLTTYDWVGKGVLNPGAQIKTPACGWCHLGGGPAEFPRDPDTGFAYDADGNPSVGTTYDQAEAAALAAAAVGGYIDGDFYTMVAGGGPSHWQESGVAEVDCLLCHLHFSPAGETDGSKKFYNFGGRNKQLTYRNYRWAATMGARMASISGKVYDFDESLKSGPGSFLAGTWTGVTPSVAYNLDASGNLSDDTKVVFDDAGTLRMKGTNIVRRPAKIPCLYCHEGSDTKKRGFEWSGEHDVHAAQNLNCMDCHGMVDSEDMDGDTALGSHNIGKGFAHLGSVRNDLDGSMRYDCAACHVEQTWPGAAPDPALAHDLAFGEASFHFDRISCESCHIPEIAFNQGYLIDMSSGKQIWMLSDGTTPTWAGDFQKAGDFVPFWKKFDQDGDAGPRQEKYFPFGAKSSAWFGRVAASGEVQPIFLRFVTAAYDAVKGTLENPTVPVRTVPYDLDPDADPAVTFDAARPSVSTANDIKAMIAKLEETFVGEQVVFVTNEVYGVDPLTGLLVVLDEFDAESCHDFSINHDTSPAAEALGAGGCTDCHTGRADELLARAAGRVQEAFDSPLYNPQIRDVTGYLADRVAPVDEALLADPTYAEPMLTFAGYSDEEANRLLQAVDLADPPSVHSALVSYATEGANACALCHADAVASFAGSVHYSSRSVVENENFFFPGGGKHGMLDRACALVGSNMLLNMLTTGYADLTDAREATGNPAQQCGGCHANYYNTLMEGMLPMLELPADTVLAGVDCLVCHAEDYDFALRKTYEPDPTGLNLGFGTIEGRPQRIRQDRSGAALTSIVRTPTDDMCLRCHEHGRTDYKRGELPEPAYDVHYQLDVAQPNPCLFCHPAADHKFNRGALVNGDLFASDYPVNSAANDTACTNSNCHLERPHFLSNALNDHVARVACETCHIPYTAGAETTIWADGGFLALAKGRDNLPVKLYTKKEEDHVLDAEELWQTYRQRPVYMPFSGLTSFLAQAIPLANPNTEPALEPKVFPFKTVINPLPFDGRFFGVGIPDPGSIVVPTGFGYSVNQFSMFMGFLMFQDQYKALGFMDADFDFALFANDARTGMLVTTVEPTAPGYPSYAAMAQMAQFPAMLFFDKYTFGDNWYQNLEEMAAAGEITPWDYDAGTGVGRPLAAQDMKLAVAVGMARTIDMMVMMGFDPTAFGFANAAEVKAMYANLSDDQLITMNAPPGSEMQLMLREMGYSNWANYPAWSNGITLGGHGVRRDEALTCDDCHNPQRSVLSQKVEVPTYGPNNLPLMHWEFYSKELQALASQGVVIEDVWAAGYAVRSDDFELLAEPFVTATEAAAALGLTFGKDGDYLAVLTPTTRLVSNWDVLGYSAQRQADLLGVGTPLAERSGGGSSSECFIQTLGSASGGGWGWLAGLGAVLGALWAVPKRRP